MGARVVTVAFQGAEAVRVEVEAPFTGGEVRFIVVGLGDKAVTEGLCRRSPPPTSKVQTRCAGSTWPKR